MAIVLILLSQDSGLQVDHPEFLDANGVSRVQQIDWYAASGIFGSQSASHYGDTDGHGTTERTATGLNFGWASNARVYSVKVGGLEGPGDTGGISISSVLMLSKAWHPINRRSNTGFKRPNNSKCKLGIQHKYRICGITSIVYRGTTYSSGNDASFNSTINPYERHLRILSLLQKRKL